MSPKCCCCRRNVFTEVLPSNDKAIHRATDTYDKQLYCCISAGKCLPSCYPTAVRTHVETLRLTVRIYCVRPSNGLKFPDVHTKFREGRFRLSKVNG
jgi:hypothetical protein